MIIIVFAGLQVLPVAAYGNPGEGVLLLRGDGQGTAGSSSPQTRERMLAGRRQKRRDRKQQADTASARGGERNYDPARFFVHLGFGGLTGIRGFRRPPEAKPPRRRRRRRRRWCVSVPSAERACCYQQICLLRRGAWRRGSGRAAARCVRARAFSRC